MAATDKILRNTGAQLTVTFYTDGVPTDADGAVSLVVTREGSDTPIFDGAASDATALDGTYEWVLPPQTALMKLTLSWTGTFSSVVQTVTTSAEVVGSHLFSVADARAFRPARGSGSPIGKLADVTKYPTAEIVDIREELTEFLTVALGFSPIQRYGRAALDGNGKVILYLPALEAQSVQAASVDGVALTVADDLTLYNSGRLAREGSVWTVGNQNVVIEFEHGLAEVPAEIARAALVLLVSLMVGTDILDRSITHTDETGTYRLSTPDALRDHPTGIPYVDSIINRYRHGWIVQ